MNALDVILGIAIGLGVVVGARQGMLRPIIGLGALYVSLVFASYFRGLLGDRILFLRPQTGRDAAEFLAFLILLTTLYGVLAVISRRAFPETRWKSFRILDLIGGGLAAFWLVSLQVALVLAILKALGFVDFLGEGMGRLFLQALDSSSITFFLRRWLGIVAESMRIWLPGGVPDLFYLL
ncbi:MAG: CvpA family protein [Chloroflexi bacterium]|nr:CvpA family protein [Chloroflexota bacterium]